MNDINILEELGLAEVSRKTHIETKTLEYMVNKEFSKLNRLNTLGFIKILRREYNLDLQSWVDEFEEYLQSKTLENISNTSVLQQDIKPEKSKAWIYFLLLFLIILGVGFWRFDGMQYFNQIKQKFFEKNTSTFTQAPIIAETKEKLDALEERTDLSTHTAQNLEAQANIKDDKENRTNQEANEKEVDLELSTDPSITPQSVEEKLISRENEEENISTQEATSAAIISIETNQSKNEITKEFSDEPILEKEEKYISKELLIKPNKKIWIGAVNLTSKKRSTWLSTSPIKIDIRSPQLLIVGHGDFIFDLGNDKTQAPANKLKAYYKIQDGEIKHISQKEFIRENGGRNW